MAKKESRPAELVSATQIIDAPYELPEGWKWVTIKDCCETFADGDWIESKDQSNDGIRLIQTGNIGNGNFRDKEDKYHFISEDTFKKLNCTEIFAGDILISRLPEPVGRSCIIPELQFKMITAVDCTIVRLFENITNKKWFCYYTQTPSYDELIKGSCTGTTRLRISRNNLGNLPFPLAPFAEQQRIVNRIESMFAKLDEAKEKAQNVVDSFEPRKAAILHQAFTGKLTENWRKENGVSEDSWKYVKLEDIVKKEKNALKAGPFGSSLKKEFYVSSGYKIYGQEQVLNSDENYGDYFIDETKYKELESCKISPNDILISLVGTVGKTLILSENCLPGIINPRLIKITLDLGIMIPQFFTYYFGSDYCKNKYKTVQHGTTMDVLNMGILKSLDYPCCSLNEQHEIVRILDTVLEKERTAKSAAEQVLKKIDLLEKSILARAFRGEL